MSFSALPTLNISENFNKILLAIITSGVVFGISSGVAYSLRSKLWLSNPIPNIPIVESKIPYFGFSSLISSSENRDSHELVKKVCEKYPIFQCLCFGEHFVVVQDPNWAKSILSDVVGKGLIGESNLFFEQRDRNIVNLDTNADWQLRRDLFRKAFLLTSLLEKEDILQHEIKRFADSLQENLSQPIEIDRKFGMLAVRIVSLVAFQYDLSTETEEFQEVMKSIEEIFQSFWYLFLPFSGFLNYLPTPIISKLKFFRSRLVIRKFCEDILSSILSKGDADTLDPDSLAHGIYLLSKSPGITRRDLVNEVFVIFIAGHETTAHTLSWIIFSLATHPEIQTRVQTEIDEYLRDPNHSKTELPPYSEAVVKETMRRYPAIPLGSLRKVTSTDGYTLSTANSAFVQHPGLHSYNSEVVSTFPENIFIPSGKFVRVCFYPIHNSTENYGQSALDFIPERWLPFSPITEAQKFNFANKTIQHKDESEEEFKTSEFSTESKSAEDHSLDESGVLVPSSHGEHKIASKESNVGEKEVSLTSIVHSTPKNPLAAASVYYGGGPTPESLTFCPFSHGKRVCLGMNLALMEIRMTTMELMSRFTFSLADPTMAEDPRTLETMMTLRPARRLPVIVELREPTAMKTTTIQT